jgi:urease accessory protein
VAELLASLAVSATALLLLCRRRTPLAAGGIVALAVAVHALLHGQEAQASPAWWIAALASSSLVVGLGLLCGRRLAPLPQRRLALGLGLSGLVLASLQALG